METAEPVDLADDYDDLYGASPRPSAVEETQLPTTASDAAGQTTLDQTTALPAIVSSTLPGLALSPPMSGAVQERSIQQVPAESILVNADHTMSESTGPEITQSADGVVDDNTSAGVGVGESKQGDGHPRLESAIPQQESTVEMGEPQVGQDVMVDAVPTAQSEAHVQQDAVAATEPPLVPGSEATADEGKAEFIEAGQTNKDDMQAEWQLDSSDNDSSDSDSSSDDSSSEEEDEDYEMLDPATAARMLMAEEGGEDDEGPATKGGNSGLRTKNEQPAVLVPKPDITVTDAMHVVLLGSVEHIVEAFAVVRGFTSGEYQVLEQGSVLCLENKTVIGVVAETLGRVQDPMYSVAFTDQAEIEALGITRGSKICYVQEHSTFVFTQPLKGLRGTDASNIHDEEVGDEEIEFSDDEAEAAYKRERKLAKRGGGKAQGRDRDDVPTTHHAANSERRIISYDDDDGDVGPSSLPSGNYDGGRPPMAGERSRRGGFDRGRVRGRARADRGRGGARGHPGRGGDGPAREHPSQATQPPAAFPYSAYSPVPPPPPPPPAFPQQQRFAVPPPPQFAGYQGQYAAAPNPAWMQSLLQYPPPPNPFGQMPAPQGSVRWAAPSPAAGGAWPAQNHAGAVPDAYQAALQQMEILRRLNGGQ